MDKYTVLPHDTGCTYSMTFRKWLFVSNKDISEAQVCWKSSSVYRQIDTSGSEIFTTPTQLNTNLVLT